MSNMQRHEAINTLWLKASVTGSLWAASEIILGSFLHNLHVPFSGPLLSVIGIILLVSGSRLWGEKGMIWRAGVICAVMKTVSPSADILGPMVSIAAEAFILEGMVNLFGMNFIGYAVGGGLAVSWSLFYKIASLILLYGYNIIKLYANIYLFALKQLNIPGSNPFTLILLLFGIYFLAGGAAAVIGMRVKRDKEDHSVGDTNIQTDFLSQLRSVETRRQFSLLWLLLHTAVLVSGLMFVDTLPLPASAILVLVYASACLIIYPEGTRRLKKPKFWLTFILITLLSGMLLNELNTKDLAFTWFGIEAGIKMNVRAFLIIFAFSGISIELRSPKITSWLSKKGMGQFSASLETAFGILPFIAGGISGDKDIIKHPLKSFSRMVRLADQWIIKMSSNNIPGSKVFILSGGKGSGKTTLLSGIVAELKSEGISVGGILAHGIWKENERYGFNIEDVSNGDEAFLCGIDVEENILSVGPFKFTSDGINLGRKALSPEKIDNNNVVVIDEIGPLELEGKGWAAEFELLLKTKITAVIIVVRRRLVDETVIRWDLKNYEILKAEETLPRAASDKIMEYIKDAADNYLK